LCPADIAPACSGYAHSGSPFQRFAIVEETGFDRRRGQVTQAQSRDSAARGLQLLGYTQGEGGLPDIRLTEDDGSLGDGCSRQRRGEGGAGLGPVEFEVATLIGEARTGAA